MSYDLYSSDKPKHGEFNSTRSGCGCTGLLILTFSVLATVAIAAIFIIPFGAVFSADFARSISPLFCDSDRVLVVESGSRFSGQISSFTMNDVPTYFYCANHDGNFERADEVTDRFGFMLAVLGGAIPIFILAAVFMGVGRSMSRAAHSMTTMPAQVQTINLSAANLKRKNDQPDDLSERLRELQELYDQGLITIDEYNQKRQDILQDL